MHLIIGIALIARPYCNTFFSKTKTILETIYLTEIGTWYFWIDWKIYLIHFNILTHPALHFWCSFLCRLIDRESHQLMIMTDEVFPERAPILESKSYWTRIETKIFRPSFSCFFDKRITKNMQEIKLKLKLMMVSWVKVNPKWCPRIWKVAKSKRQRNFIMLNSLYSLITN